MDIDHEIDDILKSFQSSGKVSGEDGDSASSDPVRWCQYKPHSGANNSRNDDGQVQRREKVLREQNRLRDAKLAEMRQAKKADVQQVDAIEVCSPAGNVEVESTTPSPNRLTRRRNYRYGDDPDLLQPMLSEWMLTVPDDLATEWLLMLCPVGRRNMVVASNGSTRVYSKTGKQVMQFSSMLPAGGCDRASSSDGLTAIDGIFSQADLTFYVLDLLAWNGTFLAETDTECRQFFLRSRFAENSELAQSGVHNSGYRFVLAPVVDECSPSAILKALDEQPKSPAIDGLLFYHRRCFYTHGVTPTVLWLRPFMLSTTLGISTGSSLTTQNDPLST